MENNIQKALGKRIQELRKDANFSQEQFAEKIGVAVNTLSNIERGNAFMTAQTMERIVRILKINPQELFEFPDWNCADSNSYKYIINRVNLLRDDEYRLEKLRKFLKFVL